MLVVCISKYLSMLSDINGNLLVNESDVHIVNSFLEIVKRNYDRAERDFIDEESAKIVSKIKRETDVDKLRELVKQLRELEF